MDLELGSYLFNPDRLNSQMDYKVYFPHDNMNDHFRKLCRNARARYERLYKHGMLPMPTALITGHCCDLQVVTHALGVLSAGLRS